MCVCVCGFQEGLKGAVMRFMHTHVCGTFWLATCEAEGTADGRISRHATSRQGWVMEEPRKWGARRGNCEILRAFYYNYCYAYAMWHEQQQHRQHSPLRVINRLTIIHPGQQNKGEKESQDVGREGASKVASKGATQRAARQGKARQGEAIKAQDLKYFPSGGPFGGAAGHAYHQ